MTGRWHTLTAEQVMGELTTSSGLTSAEAGKRLERYGSNELTSKGGTSPLGAERSFIILLSFLPLVTGEVAKYVMARRRSYERRGERT